MKPSFTQSPGTGLIIQSDTSGWSDPAGNGITPIWVENAHTKVVNSRDMNYGDHKSPNDWSFSKSESTCMQGTEVIMSYGTKGPLAGGGYGLLTTTHQSGCFNEYSLDPISVVSDTSFNSALSDLTDGLRGTLDLSVAVAEAPQTYRLLKSTIGLAKYVLKFHPKHWAGHFLEYKFGWYPLVMDIHGAAQEIAYKAPQIMKKRGRATVRGSRTRTTVSQGTKRVDQFFSSYRTEIGVTYAPSQNTVDKIARFASLNPASIAWEILPGSFLVDYLIDIGGALRSLEASMVLNGGFLTGYVSKGSLERCQSTLYGTGVKIGGVVKTGSRTAWAENRNFTRERIFSIPSPTVPRFNSELGANQQLVVAAILGTFLDTKGSEVNKSRKVSNDALDEMLRNFRNGPRTWTSNDAYSR